MKGGAKMESVPSKGRVVIDRFAKPVSYDEVCREIYGLSLKELIREIQINAGGKYDRLYKKKKA